MADFEDALSPTWSNVVQGHLALRQAVTRTLERKLADGKLYRNSTHAGSRYQSGLLFFVLWEFFL